MIEIYPNLYIGNEADAKVVIARDGWRIVHACKEPYHRQALGYAGRGAPKEHPEYLVAKRGNRLILNLVDADDPAYIPKQIIDEALAFVHRAMAEGQRVLVHCNQGQSRSAVIGLLCLATFTDRLPTGSVADAEATYRQLYPPYNPKAGMRGFLLAHWDHYCAREEPSR